MNLEANYQLHGVIIQGRSDAAQWVTSYKVQYKADGQSTFTNVLDDNGSPKVGLRGLWISIRPFPIPIEVEYSK